MLTQNDIEAELSYAYLHAVAARAGVACQASARPFDNAGIDAVLNLREDFGERALLKDMCISVQLKSTISPPLRNPRHSDRLSYFLKETAQYDYLRSTGITPHRVLAVLFLPNDCEDWLKHSAEQLALRNCAYWVSLAGAPPSLNGTGQTIYFPDDQRLSPAGLRELFRRVAHGEDMSYVLQ